MLMRKYRLDPRPVCVWRSRSETSPCGMSSRCSPACLQVDRDNESALSIAIVSLHISSLPSTTAQRLIEMTPSLTLKTTGGRRASPFPNLLSFPLWFKGGITFHQPSSPRLSTIVIAVHSHHLLFPFLLVLQNCCLFISFFFFPQWSLSTSDSHSWTCTSAFPDITT